MGLERVDRAKTNLLKELIEAASKAGVQFIEFDGIKITFKPATISYPDDNPDLVAETFKNEKEKSDIDKTFESYDPNYINNNPPID